jgi:uroporphyrinogen-III synthase
MPLTNKHIIVTRAAHQAEKLVKILQDKGAVPLIYPCINIAPLENNSELDSALRNLETYDWLILTSSNTILALCRRIRVLEISVNWLQIKIAAVGHSTASVAESLFGVKPDFIPTEHAGKALAETLPLQENMHVFLPQSDVAGVETSEILQNRGIDVTVVAAYENIIGQDGANIPLYLEENRVDAITFTSGSTVEGFIQRIKPLIAYDLPVACIGSSTAEVAQNYGFKNIIVPKKNTLKDMLEALEQHFVKIFVNKNAVENNSLEK